MRLDKKLVDCLEISNKGEIDADTSCQIEKQILTDEIQDPELLKELLAQRSTEVFLPPTTKQFCDMKILVIIS